VTEPVGARIIAREFSGEAWRITVTAAHADVPAAAIAEELARAFATEVHTAGGVKKPMRAATQFETTDATSLAQLRGLYLSTSSDTTITIPTIEGDVIVKTLAGKNTFSILTGQRFIRMALALAFSDVPIPVEWVSD